MRATRTPGLYLRGRIYTLRLVLPAKHPGESRQEIVLSLGTSNPKRAKMLALEVKRYMNQLLNAEPELAHAAVRERLRLFARDYFRRTMGEANEEISLRKGIDDASEVAAEKQADLMALQQRLHKGPTPIHNAEAQSYLQQHYPQLVGDKEALGYLASLMLRAEVEATRLVAAKLMGNYAAFRIQDETFAGMDPDIIKPAPEGVGARGELTFPAWWTALSDGTTPPLTLPNSQGGLVASLPQKLLSDVIASYLNEKREAKLNPKTIEDIEVSLSFISFAFPSLTHVGQITKQHLIQLHSSMPKLPNNFKKHKKLQKLSFTELVSKSHKDVPTISGKTARKYLQTIRSFIDWCKDQELISDTWQLPQMPKYLGPKASKQDREPFTEEQLIGIFNSPLYMGHHPDLHSQKRRWKAGKALARDGFYWVPLLALFTGARMTELLQLHLADIREKDGIFYLDINDDSAEKSLKTASSRRPVPLHPMLEQLGFKAFLEARKQGKPTTRLFNDIELGTKQPHSIYSKAFSYYLEKIKQKSKKTSFHSFRHNFVDASRRAQLNRTVEYALVGHVEGDDVHSNYGSAPLLSELKEAMDKITYPAPVLEALKRLAKAAEKYQNPTVKS